MKLALKINVDTYRGTLQGVPRLVETLRRNRAGASFLFSLGTDHTGRVARHAFNSGLTAKAPQTSLIARYGIKTLLYGTLLPGPDIGKGCGDILRSTRDAGFETAIHCWDRLKWLDDGNNASAIWTEIEMRRAHERYVEIFDMDSPGHAAAGWQMNPHALRLTQRLGYRWASDCRGTHPFMPVWNGEVIHCPQLPTTLPTLDELIGTNGITVENVHEHLLNLTATPCESGHVYTLHAELEGMAFGATLEVLLTGWREQGYELTSLGALRDSLDPALLPRHELVRSVVSGRSSPMMVQGEEFLSSWKEAA